jgi:hypothetical protein
MDFETMMVLEEKATAALLCRRRWAVRGIS